MIRMVALIALLLFASASQAADMTDPNGTFSDLLELVRNNANMWSGRLRAFAVQIFWFLASIQLVWTLAPLVARRADLAEAMSEIALFVVKTLFFFSLLTYSVDFGQAIVNSFRHAGAVASGMPVMLNPGDMLTMGVMLGNTVSDVDTWNPVIGIGIVVSSLIILMSFAFIAAFMGLALVESYIVINAAMFFMGFGGSQFTREYALAMPRYGVAVGAKLFVMTLIVGIVMAASKDWQASYKHDSTSTMVLVAMSLVSVCFTKTVPDLVYSLISGVSPGGGSVIGGMAAAGMALGTAAAATIGAKLASSNLMSGGSGGGGIASIINSGLGGGGSPASSMMNAMTGGSSSGSGARPTSSSPSGPSSGSSPMSGKAKMAHAAHAATAGAVRTVGGLASMTVPGMEGSEHTSLGPSPFGSPPSGFETVADIQETPENIIHPEAPESPRKA